MIGDFAGGEIKSGSYICNLCGYLNSFPAGLKYLKGLRGTKGCPFSQTVFPYIQRPLQDTFMKRSYSTGHALCAEQSAAEQTQRISQRFRPLFEVLLQAA